MQNDEIIRDFYPNLCQAVEHVENGEVTDLHSLDWETLADEMCLLYVSRHGEWSLDDAPTFVTDPHALSDTHDNDDIDELLLGLHVFLTASDNLEVRLRLMDACAWHIDTLVQAVHPSCQMDWLRFLTLTLVEGTGHFVTRYANQRFENELRPAIIAETREEVLERIRGAVDGMQSELRNSRNEVLIPKITWLNGTSVWHRILPKAHHDDRAEEIDDQLRSLCREGSATELSKYLRLWFFSGYLDIGQLKKRALYDELCDQYTKLPYSYDNFKRYFSLKHRL